MGRPYPGAGGIATTDETLRLFLAALGRALVETFGNQPAHPAAPAPLPAPVQEPQPVKAEPTPEDQPKRKVFSAKIFTCAVCGCRFEANAPHAKRCPECREKLRVAKLVELSNRKRQDVNLWEGPSQDADMVYGNSIDM